MKLFENLKWFIYLYSVLFAELPKKLKIGLKLRFKALDDYDDFIREA